MAVDFSFILPRLATGGGILSDGDAQHIVAAGIDVVVDCRAEYDDSPLFANYSQVHYLWNGTADNGAKKDAAWFQRSLDFAMPLYALPNHRCLFHCAQGINRGPSTAFAIMLALGWSALEAKALIRLKRPATLPGIRYADDAEAAVKALGYV